MRPDTPEQTRGPEAVDLTPGKERREKGFIDGMRMSTRSLLILMAGVGGWTKAAHHMHEYNWEFKTCEAVTTWEVVLKAESRYNIQILMNSVDEALQKEGLTREDIGITEQMVKAQYDRAKE